MGIRIIPIPLSLNALIVLILIIILIIFIFLMFKILSYLDEKFSIIPLKNVEFKKNILIVLAILHVIYFTIIILNSTSFNKPYLHADSSLPHGDSPLLPRDSKMPTWRLSLIEGEISDNKGNVFHFNRSTPNRANLSPAPDNVWGYVDINSELIKIKIEEGMIKNPLPYTEVEVYWDHHFSKNQSLVLGHEVKNTDSKGEAIFSKSEAIRNYDESGLYLNVTQIYFHIEPKFLQEYTSEIYIYEGYYNISYH